MLAKLSSFTLCRYILVAAIALFAPITASATDNREVATGVPAILSDNDVKIYKKLFTLQRSLKRDDVVALIPKLDDKKVLMGHLVAERILHPKTKAPYVDMQNWLRKYHDHAQARTIYKIANSRRVAGNKHRRPSTGSTASIAQYSDPDYELKQSKKSGKQVRKTKARSQKLRQLKSFRINKKYDAAITQLSKRSTKKLLGEDTYNQVSLRLAQQMLNDGKFAKASQLAEDIFKQSSRPQPDALWISAFSAYQKKDLEKAASTFRQMAYLVPPQSTQYARASFWAAKSYEELGRRSMARVFYNMAVQQPSSFYGMLAQESLGRSLLFRWDTPTINPAHKKTLLKDAGIRRVIALVQIGEHKLAQREMKASYSRIPYGLDESLLAMAIALKLPSVSLTLAKNLKERGQIYLTGLYPRPQWEPVGGFKVDKALLYSIIRQESGFVPKIKSHADARGLMQIMPRTAKHIRDVQKRARIPANKLYDPNVNMMLGQDYLMYLDNKLSGNLVQMIAAYNAGPGNVSKWRRNGLVGKDPLLFIERIPFEETRKYVMAVLSNLWVYRHYYYGEAPTMALVTKGMWPERAKAYAQLKDKTRSGL